MMHIFVGILISLTALFMGGCKAVIDPDGNETGDESAEESDTGTGSTTTADESEAETSTGMTN